MPAKITFNGIPYDSPDAMPPAVRAAYDRALAALQPGSAGGPASPRVSVRLNTRVRFVKDGRTYEDPGQMPPDVRAAYDKAMQQVDKDGNGIPDLIEQPGATSLPPAAPAEDPFPISPSAPIATQSPVIMPERPFNRALLPIAAAMLAILLLAALMIFVLVNH